MLARKKVTLEELIDNWKDVAIELYSQGASDVEVRCALARGGFSSLSDDLWYRLIEEEEEFSRTIKKGRLISNSWWEKEGRVNLKEPRFNYTGWYMNMKNRFKWADKQDINSVNQNHNTNETYEQFIARQDEEMKKARQAKKHEEEEV